MIAALVGYICIYILEKKVALTTLVSLNLIYSQKYSEQVWFLEFKTYLDA